MSNNNNGSHEVSQPGNLSMLSDDLQNVLETVNDNPANGYEGFKEHKFFDSKLLSLEVLREINASGLSKAEMLYAVTQFMSVMGVMNSSDVINGNIGKVKKYLKEKHESSPEQISKTKISEIIDDVVKG